MDLISYYYFSELAKDLHITRTANRLYITQQTLSNHIHRLENYYGTTLIDRGPPMSLTFAGNCVLDFAKNLLMSHDNLKDTISDVAVEKRGAIRFGISMIRANNIIPQIYPIFKQKYPYVNLSLTYDVSNELEKMVIAGDLDIAMVLSTDDSRFDPGLETQFLMRDYVLLCISDYLLDRYFGDGADALRRDSKNGADLRRFAEVPFCLPNNRLGQQIRQVFEEAKVVPQQHFVESTLWFGMYPQFTRYFAACFTSHPGLITGNTMTDVNYFPLLYRGRQVCNDLYVISSKKRYLPQYFLFFISLIKDYCNRIERQYLSQRG